jgi:hypothetical protein
LTFAPGPARAGSRSVESVETKETHDDERLERRHDLGGLVLHGPVLGAADLKVETGGDAFPGYYTLEALRNGQIEGMISVNAPPHATSRDPR